MNNKYYKKQLYDNDLKPKEIIEPKVAEVKTVIEAKEVRQPIEPVEQNYVVESEVIFDPPKKDNIVEILEVSNETGEISHKVISSNFVVVKGYVNKGIMYTTTKKEELDRFNDFQREQMGITQKRREEKEENNENAEKEKEEKNEKGKEEKNIRKYVALDGVIRHATLSVPFELPIYIPGVTPEDELDVKIEIVEASAGSEIIKEEEKIIGLREMDIVKVTVSIK